MAYGFDDDKSKFPLGNEINNLLHVEKITDSNVKISANAGAAILFSTPVISGYSLVGVVGCDVAPTNPPNFNVTIQSCSVREDSVFADVFLALANSSNADVYVDIALYLLYAKTNAIDS